MTVAAGHTSDRQRSDDLTELLARGEDLLADLLPSGARNAAALATLRERLVEGHLQVAVLGQFKRGKSSFLNALLGVALLPTGVVPFTAVATFIRWAETPSIRVAYLDGRPEGVLRSGVTNEIRDQLARFVTEEHNPRNRLRVARVELLYPAPMLRRGIVLIDTPGIGSTLRHNTDAAVAVLPECDAGFFVLSADPPITEAELAYLDRARPHVARLFFVFNKIDYLAPGERDTAVAFLRGNLREHLAELADAPIFRLSARRALAAREAGDAARLAESGLVEIERHLVDFLGREKVGSLRHAVAKKAAAVLDTALMDGALASRALELPAEELEARAAEFADALAAVERQQLVARDLLAGDRRRAVERLEQQAAELRDEASHSLLATLAATLEDAAATPVTAAKSAIAAAIPEFFEPRLARMARDFSAIVEDILKGHVERAEALIRSVRERAASLFEIPSIPMEDAESFIFRREPYWVTEHWSDSLNAFGSGFVDRLLPAASRTARRGRRLAAEIDELVGRNVENLRWATLQNLDAAFRRFAALFDERLSETITATQGAIATAADKRRLHAEAVEAEIERLRHATDGLRELRHSLARSGQ